MVKQPLICVLVKVTICVAVLAAGYALLLPWRNWLQNWRTDGFDAAKQSEITYLDWTAGRNWLQNWRADFEAAKHQDVGETTKNLLATLVREEARNQLEITGFSCQFDKQTAICLSAKPVRISNGGLTIHIPYDESMSTRSVQPYAKRVGEEALKSVNPVQVLHGSINGLPTCNFTHDVPAVVFSSGLIGNTFHEFSEIIIPLFLTCRHFHSQVKFVITDYNQRWVEKYGGILNGLSNYKALDLVTDRSVHCFPGTVVGLRYHDHLALNSSDVPSGHSMPEFRQFLRKTYNVKIKNVPKMGKLQRPVLVLVSRQFTRKILNEGAVVKLARKLGFRVRRLNLNTISNLRKISLMLSSCNVFVGVHGAGLVNEIFLPDVTVVIQVVPLGLEWASTNYFEVPSIAMGLQYLEYKIEPKESSLSEKYNLDHPVIVDPGSIFAKGYKVGMAIYVDGQNLKINLARFNETLIKAIRLVGNSRTIS